MEMPTMLSRRSFLKGGLVAVGTLAAKPLSVAASTKNESSHLATLIDISKCIGCEACVLACNEVNLHKYPEPIKPFPKMIPKKQPCAIITSKTSVEV